MTVNFTKYQEAISDAWKAIIDEKNSINWVLLGYENQTNILKILEKGSDLQELVNEFKCSQIQYAFCRIKHDPSDINKLVLIHWQGESAPLTRKGLCASHVNDVANYFKGCSQTITLRNEDEATPDYIMQQIRRSSSARINIRERSEIMENMEPVGTNYKPLKVSQEIGTIDRKKFWQLEEEAEKRRIEEEKIRAEEKRLQFEKERKQREAAEAKKMEQSLLDREKSIDATRQANLGSEKNLKSNNQPNSISVIRQNDKDDARPGAQSDLIRRERNQETFALISKGTIKNKRAIFEQQVTNNTPNNTSVNRLERRPSGVIVTERVKAFRSLETSVPQPKAPQQSVRKISFNNSSRESTPAIQNGDTHEVRTANETASILPVVDEPKSFNDSAIVDQVLTPSLQQTNITESPNHVPETIPQSNGVYHNVDSNDTKTKIELDTSSVEEAQSVCSNALSDTVENINSPDKSKCKSDLSSSNIEVPNLSAKAIYDYQAADSTEISFDPDDIICHIEKVDPGWWQGIVATGKYKDQVGLFPSNYVELLP